MASKFLSDFKDFISRGNIVDLAVGIIIGTAFTAIVNSLVSDVLMPPIGWAAGNIDFSNFYYDPTHGHYDSLDAARKAGAPVVAYGLLINNIIKFLIVAFTVFLIVRAAKKAEEKLHIEGKKAGLTTDQSLLTEIRDLLKQQQPKP